MIHYIAINDIINIYDWYIRIDISDRDLFVLNMSIAGISLFIILYLYVRSHKKLVTEDILITILEKVNYLEVLNNQVLRNSVGRGKTWIDLLKNIGGTNMNEEYVRGVNSELIRAVKALNGAIASQPDTSAVLNAISTKLDNIISLLEGIKSNTTP